jgi:hypothetical protein
MPRFLIYSIFLTENARCLFGKELELLYFLVSAVVLTQAHMQASHVPSSSDEDRPFQGGATYFRYTLVHKKLPRLHQHTAVAIFSLQINKILGYIFSTS